MPMYYSLEVIQVTFKGKGLHTGTHTRTQASLGATLETVYHMVYKKYNSSSEEELLNLL